MYSCTIQCAQKILLVVVAAAAAAFVIVIAAAAASVVDIMHDIIGAPIVVDAAVAASGDN